MVPLKTWTTKKIREAKGAGTRLACLTAYDFTTARIMDGAGIPLILVGDSLGMTMLGYANTLPVTLDHMIHHTAAVSRGVANALVVADMPFMTYQVSDEQALTNAGRLLQEGGADAVKIEGGGSRVSRVARLTECGIPVLAHIGLTPQSVNQVGGFRLQGKSADDARRLLDDAVALAEAGAFAIVLECVPAPLARAITEAVPIPTIGIGAGPSCDGQILVYHDMLGLNDAFQPTFVKRYAALADSMRQAFSAYAEEVASGVFPAAAQSFGAITDKGPAT
jgi:3-methyl-2-oxobutanoate hydroxymethyltransferase